MHKDCQPHMESVNQDGRHEEHRLLERTRSGLGFGEIRFTFDEALDEEEEAEEAVSVQEAHEVKGRHPDDLFEAGGISVGIRDPAVGPEADDQEAHGGDEAQNPWQVLPECQQEDLCKVKARSKLLACSS